MEGSILLHRKLLDSEVFASEKRLKVWLWLLLRASYKERHIPIAIGKGESIITIQRGQLIFGRYKAEETLNIDGSTIYKILQWMEKEEMIIIESNSHYTILTINNYSTFQTFENEKVATIEQPLNNQIAAIEQPSNNRVTHTSKNKQDKQDNKVNCLFKNSEFNTIELFSKQFNNTEWDNADLKYYFDSMMDWSNAKGKLAKDWIATARNWMRKDKQENKLKLKVNQGNTIWR